MLSKLKKKTMSATFSANHSIVNVMTFRYCRTGCCGGKALDWFTGDALFEFRQRTPPILTRLL
jgi:hypothetical protein